MAIGLPAIVSDAPGNVDAVGDAGVVVPAGDVDGLRDALVRLAADASLRTALGERARKRVEDRFSLEQMLDGTRRVYSQVLDDPRKKSPTAHS
jgi:glycosyltransferase involved in cell wall biosynthesis